MAAKQKKTAKKTSAKKAPAKKKIVIKKATPKKVAAKKAAPAKPAGKPLAAKSKTASLSLEIAKNLPRAITPLDDRIIVAPEVPAEKTAGGLFIPNAANDRPSRGVVLVTGAGRRTKKGKLRPLDVNVGDEVLFAQYSGSKISILGQDVLILREEDVLGIVT